MLGCVLSACLVAAMGSMETRLTRDAVALHARGIDAFAYTRRLVDLENLVRPMRGPVRPDAVAEVRLELKLDDDILTGAPPVFPGSGDAIDAIFPGTSAYQADAVAIYMPSNLPKDEPDSMVVILHGRGETESNVIATGLFRRLADAHHAILVAPWAQNSTAWNDGAEGEVLALVNFIGARYHLDAKSTYFAGISMGGAGALRIAAHHPERFEAVLSIAGDVDPGESLVLHRLHDRRVYLVNAGADPIMTPAVQATTWRLLTDACVSVSRYLAPHSGHGIDAEMAEQVTLAWSDMFSGIQRRTPGADCVN